MKNLKNKIKKADKFNLPEISNKSFEIKINSNKKNEITIIRNNLNSSILDNII